MTGARWDVTGLPWLPLISCKTPLFPPTAHLTPSSSLAMSLIGQNSRKYMYIPVKNTRKTSSERNLKIEESQVNIDRLQPTTCNDSTGFTSHQQRQLKSLSRWNAVRENIANAFIEESSLPYGSMCVVCLNERATIQRAPRMTQGMGGLAPA